jgi:uncharacterized protein (DUF697 family)
MASKSVLEEKEMLTAKAKAMVPKYMWWSMGAGLVPFPLLDMAAISGVQLKMLADLAKHYDVEFKDHRGKALVSSLLGAVAPGQLAGGMLGSVVKMVPLVGPILGGVSQPIFAGALTYAIGSVFIQHFETGGTLLDFDPVRMREHFRDEFEKGKLMAQEVSRKTQKD